MYKLKVEKAPNSDISKERYESDIQDIANVIPDKLSDVDDDAVFIDGNILCFESSLGEHEIKELLKDAFSYHVDNLRLSSLIKC